MTELFDVGMVIFPLHLVVRSRGFHDNNSLRHSCLIDTSIFLEAEGEENMLDEMS